jgi:hypothetical protein
MQPGMLFAVSVRHAAQYSPPDTIDRAIDCDVHVSFGILGHDIRCAGERDVDAAFLVDSAARSVHIRQSHSHVLDAVRRVLEGEAQAALRVLGKCFGELESLGMDIDFHDNLLSVLGFRPALLLCRP